MVLDVFDLTKTGRALAAATTKEAAFFVNPAHSVKTEGIGTGHEVVSFSNLDHGVEKKRKSKGEDRPTIVVPRQGSQMHRNCNNSPPN